MVIYQMARILLVDDEDCILRTTAILLESEGHSTVCARDGSEAQRLIDAQEFDMMITDIRMRPMDGLALIEYVHKARPSLPMVVISAYWSESTVAQVMRMGVRKYIRKPFKIKDLLGAIDLALDEPRESAAQA